jgi:hypothetical protein
MPLLNERAHELIAAYNRDARGKRYNRFAEDVYEGRRRLGNPLLPQFEAHILTGLRGFDMGRTMTAGFGDRLRSCLDAVRRESAVAGLRDSVLSRTDLIASRAVIIHMYGYLALSGTLDPKKQSHVAATKILHWLFPDLFLILDRNVARAFQKHFGVKLRDSTQPGYSAEIYFTCLEKVQYEIRSFGAERFLQLEPGTPEARIFDKIAFVTGEGLKV